MTCAGAVLLSQWMNPCRQISLSHVQKQLDSIAEQVATELLESHKDHEEIKSMLSEKGSDDSGQSSVSIDEREGVASKLRRTDLPTVVILDAINKTLYNTLQFSAPPMDQYYNLENSFIDKVIETMCQDSLRLTSLRLSNIIGSESEERPAHHYVHRLSGCC